MICTRWPLYYSNIHGPYQLLTGGPNYRHLECLFNSCCFFRLTSKQTSNPVLLVLCECNPTVIAGSHHKWSAIRKAFLCHQSINQSIFPVFRVRNPFGTQCIISNWVYSILTSGFHFRIFFFFYIYICFFIYISIISPYDCIRGAYTKEDRLTHAHHAVSNNKQNTHRIIGLFHFHVPGQLRSRYLIYSNYPYQWLTLM